jgi:RNA polymerase sigma-70 factor (ECF subfamily)
MTGGAAGLREEEIARRLRRGEPGAFDEFFDRFAGPLLSYLDGMVRDRSAAEDLVQETLLRVHQRIDRYREQGAFRAWVFRIATNLALTELRRRRIAAAVPLDEGHFEPAAPCDPGPGDRAERDRQERSIAAGFRTLSDDHRAVILLRVRGGMGIREIAQALQVPEGTVKSRIHHAVRKLREFARDRERPGDERRTHGCVR